jgi:DNA-directed RNA polymerase subunit RPC12/RpoP
MNEEEKTIMIKCPSCGVNNPEESKFCTGCGADLTPPAATGEARCSGCGAEIPADSKFCVVCGRPVAAETPPAPAFCTSCGAKLDPGSRFCTACGASLAVGPGAETGAVSGSGEASLNSYWAGLDARMAQVGFEAFTQAPSLKAERVFLRQRFDLAKAGKVTTFCAVKWFPGPLTAADVRSYSQSVFDFAHSQKGLLSRSAFQPLVVYPVLVSPTCPAEAQGFLSTHWPKRFQAYEFPVVAALESKELVCHRATPVWGMAFHAGFVREAGSLFQP